MSSKTIKTVHTEHCCRIHGCKYGEDIAIEGPFDDKPFIECDVVAGRLPQSSPCEYCETMVDLEF